MPSPAAGVLTEILVPEGETVEVGARLAVIGEAGAAPGARRRHRAAPAPAGGSAGARPVAPPAAPPACDSGSRPCSGRTGASRRARRRRAPAPEASSSWRSQPRGTPAPESRPEAPATAGTSGGRRGAPAGIRRSTGPAAVAGGPAAARPTTALDPASITGTGLGGRITREDVVSLLDARQAATPPAEPAHRYHRHRPPPARRHRPPPASESPSRLAASIAGRFAASDPAPQPRRRPRRPHRPRPRPRRAVRVGRLGGVTATYRPDGDRSSRSPTCGAGRPNTWCAQRPPRRTPSSPTKRTSRTWSGCAPLGASASRPRRDSPSPTSRSSPGPRWRRCGTFPISTLRWSTTPW